MLTTFGHLLKQHRTDRRLTQAHLARAIDLNGSYIARLESSERHPSRRVVLNLAKALGLNDTERDQLLAASMHLPEGDLARILEQSGTSITHPVVQAIAQAFADLSPAHREILADEIIAYIGFRLAQIKAEAQQARARRPLELDLTQRAPEYA